MVNRRKMNSGFTLVEILIVVVILGILAAIVIPQFSSAAETAKVSSTTTQLQTIRSQLELYRIQHNDTYPTVAQMWGNLTGKTDATGASGTAFGPYLQKAPKNPFENSSTVIASTATAKKGDGWVYNASTGEIKVVIKSATATKAGLTDTADVVTY